MSDPAARLPLGTMASGTKEGRGLSRMKKFVIVMISFLVLFVFLMLNYLLWDKENLQKQNATDKIEQDWLRGQNKTLQTTVDEQEAAISQLTDTNKTQERKIADLERQLNQSKMLQESASDQVETLTQAINEYRMFTRDMLKGMTGSWFSTINDARHEDAMVFFADSTKLFGKQLNREQYPLDMASIASISFVVNEEKPEDSFTVLKGSTGVYEVRAEAVVELRAAGEGEAKEKLVSDDEALKEEGGTQEETPENEAVLPFEGLTEGVNTLRLTYLYSPESQKWVIIDVVVIKRAIP